MTLWDRTFEEVSEKYPEISTESLLIDAACMDFIRRPEHFDVVVAEASKGISNVSRETGIPVKVWEEIQKVAYAFLKSRNKP